jgi:hypothetical protein
VENLLARLPTIEREFPLARVAVVAGRRLAAYELAVREAGAVHFTCSGRGLRPLVDIVCRHLAAVPQSPSSLVEQVWASLPWATAG